MAFLLLAFLIRKILITFPVNVRLESIVKEKEKMCKYSSTKIFKMSLMARGLKK